MTEPVNIDLSAVPKTLLLPLLGRAHFSQKIYSPIHDKKALELITTLNYDFENLLNVANVKTSALFWMARAYHFDEAIKAHLKKHPKAVIVNLGCGLDTSFNRVDNGHLTWVNVDLPEVIKLRERLLPPTAREIAIQASVLDYSWMDEVKNLGSDLFFFAGGLFMYFTNEQIKALFIQLAECFPGSPLIFDNISPKGLNSANKMLQKSGMTDALLQWSVTDAKIIEQWSPKIKVLAQHAYFTGIKNKYPFPWRYKLLMYLLDLSHKSGMIYLSFD